MNPKSGANSGQSLLFSNHGAASMKLVKPLIALLPVCFAPILYGQTPASWNSKAAAAYLDGRAAWWMDWPNAARDHQTFCVSCHTSAPYAVARPALRGVLAEQSASALEVRLLGNVTKRVRMWNEVEPFYPTKKETDPKTIESRGTESIFNALILVRNDEPSGKLSPDARTALTNMWAEQLKTGDAKGAWPWLQFHNSPWEGDSQYYGAALAGVAVGSAPASYRDAPDVEAGLKLLSGYLTREEPGEILINRVTALWAASKVPGLLPAERRKAIMDEAFSKQQADGGFSLSAFVGGWKRKDNTPLDPRCDGYATGLVAFALEQAGVPSADPRLKRALAWLAANQQPDGNWLAWSLNKQRDPSTDAARFMGDAATAYSVLALAGAK
jgi:squalene-hopene/tetraprenyl-beta-curcumene cyclase